MLWGIFVTGVVQAAPLNPGNDVAIWERMHPEFPHDLDSRSTRKPRIEKIMGIPVKYYPGMYAQEMNGRTLESFDLNINLFRAVNNHRCSCSEVFFSLLVRLGKAEMLIPAVILLWYFRRKRYQVLPVAQSLWGRIINGFRWFFRRDHITVLLLSQGVGVIIGQWALKTYLTQPRPAILLPNVTLNENVYFGSFPSGDSIFAVSLAVVLFTISTRWWQRTLCVVYALLIAYERMYVGAHFPLDVFTGAIIGLVVTIYMYKLVLRPMQEESKKLDNQLS